MKKMIRENTRVFYSSISALIYVFLFLQLLAISIPPRTFAETKTQDAAVVNSVMHPAPIILKAYHVVAASGYPLGSYRLIANKGGKAKIIPFQIDEVAAYEDFVLPLGPIANGSFSNKIFDKLDELSFMGNDVGEPSPPEKWSFKKPNLLFKIDARKKNKTLGAVFLGIYERRLDRPPLSKKKYVDFDFKQSNISTANFSYDFDPSNYLVVKGIDVIDKQSKKKKKIIDSSSFFLNLNLKYFLTLKISQADIISKLEAYKEGPIRTIIRVSFAYTFLKLNFEMGMYTEVSFFSNSVILPAILFNPLDGPKSLNKSSGFYYGFGTTFDMNEAQLKTNLKPYKSDNFFSFLVGEKTQSKYQLAINHPDFFMAMQVTPSWKMKNNGNIPYVYVENGDPKRINTRDRQKSLPLGKSPVNLGVYFNLGNLASGEHRMSFNLHFDSSPSQETLNKYDSLSDWYYVTNRQTSF